MNDNFLLHESPNGNESKDDSDMSPSPAPSSLYFRWASLSLSGTKKTLNDDALLLFSASPGAMQTLMNEGETSMLDTDLLFGVSDGMGGGNAGNIASTILLDELSRIIPITFHAAASGLRPDYLEYLSRTVQDVHSALNECGQVHEEWSGMSATLTLAWFTPDNMYFAHVGDSRLYLCRDREITQISEDHTFAWKQWKRGQLTEFSYRNHPRRSALYEVIGGGHNWVSPLVGLCDYKPGDRFLLCTDGLIDGLWERHIHEYLNDKSKAPSDVIQLLAQHSFDINSHDDKTLIVIDVTD